MFCYQCQETMKNKGCAAAAGMCGKREDIADLQDVLIYALKGASIYGEKAYSKGLLKENDGEVIAEALFATITNANFDPERIKDYIRGVLALREDIKNRLSSEDIPGKPCEAAVWFPESDDDYAAKAKDAGILVQNNEDVRSLRELLIYGLKGIAAYYHHAAVLGKADPGICGFMVRALASTTKELSLDEMVGQVMKAGETAVTTMALLDRANTGAYGDPEITRVNIGVGKNPGILISGHDLKDMEELLKQTDGTGVDVYTHSEMLPANYYPAFKKYKHFVGNYGNSWWKQGEEFTSFNGPILMTTNCITPVKEAYKDRVFTTGAAGYPGVRHISADASGKKDFSTVIELAKRCAPPEEIEKGEIVGGFAHAQVMALADKVVEAVKSGAIKKFVVMAGCDGRQKGREYFTEIAEGLPEDTVILTAGCAKYRYNKLQLGDIGGIPRVLDAGQCNDSYSLAVIALKLKEVFGLTDINDLPIEFDIAWYEQKAVAVLLALLSLGFKGIRLGPTLPAFLSPAVAGVLVEKFGLKPTGTVEEDLKSIISQDL